MDKPSIPFDEMAEHLLQYQLIYRNFLKNLFQSATMPMAQYHILSILRDQQQMRMSEISQIMSISRPNLTPLIDKLVQMQRVKRISDKNDRRVIYIAITKKGLEAIALEKQELSAHYQKIFSGFTQENFDNFKLALDIFAELSEIIN